MRLCETLCRHLLRWNIHDDDEPCLFKLAYVVVLYIDVLRPGMEFRVPSEPQGTLVIAIDAHSMLSPGVLHASQILKQVTKPYSFLCGVAETHVLCLSCRRRY